MLKYLCTIIYSHIIRSCNSDERHAGRSGVHVLSLLVIPVSSKPRNGCSLVAISNYKIHNKKRKINNIYSYN
jgi:hypothetical protein